MSPRVRLVLCVLVSALLLSGCAGDPAEVAARGSEELARHETSEWVRIGHPALDEVSYEAQGAYVDLAHPGAIDVDIEVPTTFRQRFDTGGRPDRQVIDQVRAALVQRGATALGTTCDPPDWLATWHYAVESRGDWLRMRLIERPEGVEYAVTVSDQPSSDYGDRECP